MTEKELITSLKRGNNLAFETLYRNYWAKVYNFAQIYILAKDEIEDVVQEVFIKVWKSRLSLKEEKNISNYLFVITRNLIFNQTRKKINEKAYKMMVLRSLHTSNHLEEEIEANDLKFYIEKLVTKMPKRQQEVFRLSRNNYLSYKEIAEALCISEKTVERHMNEALKFLRLHFKEREKT